jgi:MoxR-like ATPase
MNVWNIFSSVSTCNEVERILLHGPPGTGKTTSAIRISPDCYTVTLHEESTVAELVGMWTPKGDTFVFIEGLAVKAMREGKILVINEIDHASGSVLTSLYNILDDREMAQVTLPTGEVVRPADGFRVMATMNGNPARDLPEALHNRFELKLHVTVPHPDAIAALPPDLQELARRSYAMDNPKISFRELNAFHKLRTKSSVNVADAARAVFGQHASDVLASIEMAKKSKDEPIRIRRKDTRKKLVEDREEKAKKFRETAKEKTDSLKKLAKGIVFNQDKTAAKYAKHMDSLVDVLPGHMISTDKNIVGYTWDGKCLKWFKDGVPSRLIAFNVKGKKIVHCDRKSWLVGDEDGYVLGYNCYRAPIYKRYRVIKRVDRVTVFDRNGNMII